MQDKAKSIGSPDPKLVIQKARMALQRLAAEAERLKRISELQSLKTNPVELSVDKSELMETTKNSHADSDKFGTLDEMINLLRLMSMDCSPEPASATAANDPTTRPLNRL